jgi:hypothetical protein
VQAATALAMALGPRTPEAFTLFTYLYAATVGLTYASFAALTLETIGAGAAATKFNLLACFSNVPIFYMAPLEGFADTHWRVGAMLTLEAALGVAGVLVFALIYAVTRPRLVPAPALLA